jgi:hypothetical protein
LVERKPLVRNAENSRELRCNAQGNVQRFSLSTSRAGERVKLAVATLRAPSADHLALIAAHSDHWNKAFSELL